MGKKRDGEAVGGEDGQHVTRALLFLAFDLRDQHIDDDDMTDEVLDALEGWMEKRGIEPLELAMSVLR